MTPTPPNAPPKGIPAFFVDVIQAGVSGAVAYGLTELLHYEAKVPGNMSIYVIAGTGLWYMGVTALEKKFPKWGWLLYLIPSSLPTPPTP